MSRDTRPKPTRMTICDLCDTEIPDGQPDETASLTAGYIAHPVTSRSKRVWFIWPPPSRLRRNRNRGDTDPRRYDFHAECILRLVEDTIARTTEGTGGETA